MLLAFSEQPLTDEHPDFSPKRRHSSPPGTRVSASVAQRGDSERTPVTKLPIKIHAEPQHIVLWKAAGRPNQVANVFSFDEYSLIHELNRRTPAIRRSKWRGPLDGGSCAGTRVLSMQSNKPRGVRGAVCARLQRSKSVMPIDRFSSPKSPAQMREDPGAQLAD